MKIQFAFWQLDFKYKTKIKYVPADLHTTYSHVKMKVFTRLHSIMWKN